MKIKLKSGLTIINPVNVLNEKFRQWPWEKYDGDPPSDPNRLTTYDIGRVYQLGARTRKSTYQELIQNHGSDISNILKSIPDIAIEDATLSSLRPKIIPLFNLALDVKGIKLAGATKLLSPFRPKLIPVLDSVIEQYYWYSTSIKNESQFRDLEAAYNASWGEYIVELMQLIKDDVEAAKDQIDNILHACSEKPYSTISRVRVVESLIWFYYARGYTFSKRHP